MLVARRDVTDPEKRAGAALLASLLVHGALFVALGLRESLAPQTPLLSPLRFSGQTFDIDALGAPQEEEAAPASSLGSPVPLGKAVSPPEEQEASPEEPAEELLPLPEEPEPDLSAPERKPPTKEPSPTKSPASPANTPREVAKQLPEVPPASPTNVDPFDQALPGETSSGSESPPLPSTGAYGEASAEVATVHLFPAFLKTLPLAAKSDATWGRLALGSAGKVEIILTVNEQGQLLPVRVIEGPGNRPPTYFRRAVTINRNFLLHGRFALSREQATGSQRLILTAKVARHAPDPKTPEASGVQAFGLQGGEPPTSVYFTYFSGQHIEIEMQRRP
jgi:outer membrane biosynthesis protein TonB